LIQYIQTKEQSELTEAKMLFEQGNYLECGVELGTVISMAVNSQKGAFLA